MTVRVLVIDAEAEDLPAVLAAVRQAPAAAVVSQVLEARPVPPPLALPPAQPVVARRGRRRKAVTGKDRDDAIVEQLTFRPMRVAELADALCTDKRDVHRTTAQLYSVLKRMLRDGRVVREGDRYAVKRK